MSVVYAIVFCALTQNPADGRAVAMCYPRGERTFDRLTDCQEALRRQVGQVVDLPTGSSQCVRVARSS